MAGVPSRWRQVLHPFSDGGKPRTLRGKGARAQQGRSAHLTAVNFERGNRTVNCQDERKKGVRSDKLSSGSDLARTRLSSAGKNIWFPLPFSLFFSLLPPLSSVPHATGARPDLSMSAFDESRPTIEIGAGSGRDNSGESLVFASAGGIFPPTTATTMGYIW